MLSRVATLNIAMQYTENVAEVSLQVLCASGESVEKGIVCTRVVGSCFASASRCGVYSLRFNRIDPGLAVRCKYSVDACNLCMMQI